jgi:hypothetical protein
MRRVCTLTLFGLLCGLGLMAQSISTAQIAGVVTDASGAVIPGAQVAATQTDTQFTRATTAGANGAYTLTNLPAGPYSLKVTANGFSTYNQTGIELQVASNPTLNVKLQLGTQNQEVQVAANANMVETHSNGVGDVVTGRTITDLPLNGRQITNLILIAGGTTPGPRGDLNGNKNYPTQTISVAGGQSNGIGYELDGASNNDPFNSLNMPFPFPDALQEFKVQTGALPAQYGAHAGAAVNVVTKSGSNGFHGDLFEFVRNYAYNANNFFNNANGLPRDSLKRNQFGGTLGGPILHNKLFFFGGYQGTITRSDPTDRSSNVPTQAMLNGDFTQFASAACQGKARTLAAPFVNNTINPAQFNKYALAFLKHIPVATDPCGVINYGISQNNHDNEIIGRVDYTMSSRQSMYFRYFIAHYALPGSANEASNVLEANQVNQNDKDQTMVWGDNYTLSPNSANVFTLSLARSNDTRVVPPYPTAAELGIPVYSPVPHYMGLSIRGNGGGFSLGGGATNPGHFNSTAPQISDDFTTIHGNHQIQIGVNWIHAIMNTVNNRPSNGEFGFGSSFTGMGLGDFLLGDLSSFAQGNPDWENDRGNFLGVYAQDSWKVTPTLTLAYGVRWSPLLQQRNWSKDNFVETFSMADFAAGIHGAGYTNAPAGLTFPGDPGYPGDAYSNSHMKDMDPRIGVIWDPTGSGRTSIRASYGIFFDQPQMFFYTRMSNNPPWGATLSFNLQNSGGFSNPWADPNSNYNGVNPWPVLANVGPNMPFPSAGVYVNVPHNVKPTYVQQRDFGVQHQFGTSDAVSVSYIGNETTHLWLGTELDPAVYNSGCFSTTADAQSRSSNYQKCEANSNARGMLVLMDPVKGAAYSSIGSVDDGGTQSYNALLLSEQHRLKNGLSFRVNYTWAHCIADPGTLELTGPTYNNPANRRQDRGNCASNEPDVLNATMVGSSPFHFHGVGMLANDWRVSINFSSHWHDSTTATLGGSVTDPALNGIGSNAQTVPGATLLVPQVSEKIGSKTYITDVNPNAYTVPTIGTFGNAGSDTIPVPGFWNFDTAISRLVPMGEGKSVELRWEMFNTLNNVNLGAPSAGFGGTNVGLISSAGDARVMQFALKYAF